MQLSLLAWNFEVRGSVVVFESTSCCPKTLPTTKCGGVLGFRMTSPTTQELMDEVPDVSEIMEHRGHRLGLTTII